MDKLIINLDQQNTEGPEPDLFRYYARPLTSKLLETMELNKHFYHGDGDYLYYEQRGKIHKVLDLTGGYGANILGHRHPRILKIVQDWIVKGAPTLTQGSTRKYAGLLGKRISDTLSAETSEGPWISTFSNTGTEAVEAAYKHCLLYFKDKLIDLNQALEKEMNLALIRYQRSDPNFQKRIISNLRSELLNNIPHLRMSEERKSYLLHQLSTIHELEELLSLIRDINQRQISQRPLFIALEKAYHGKTMGALSLTANESFRDSFYLDQDNNKSTLFISPFIDLMALEEIIDSTRADLLYLGVTTAGIGWAKHSYSMVAGAFVEPIQGEAGIYPVSSSFLAMVKKFSLQEDFLLIFDEIQTGVYRTGKLASGVHTDITADIYTFSKSLGGGFAKIAATVINQRKYIEEFGFLHTSTFSDDDFSSLIALEVLNILQGNESPVPDGLRTSDYLVARLSHLRNLYPEIIKDIRGKGMMLAIEFNDRFAEMGFEFKAICDSRMQGYLLASVLLNHENIRMSPSLSNNLTLRIQPSLYFNIIQAEELISALQNVCVALSAKRVDYFLSSIYPGVEIDNVQTPDLKTEVNASKRPLSVFLCHLIDGTHVKKVSTALKDLDENFLLRKLALSKDLAEFQVYHAQTLLDRSGNEMDVVMLGIPITSEELKKSFTSRQKYKIVQKVQRALDFAKELGATTVGLGQFTSIISGNGLYLNPKGMNLTTGNAFTVSLTIQAALRSAEDKGMNLRQSTVSLIGAAGNIMSVATSLMADHVGKIRLLHHSPIESSLKFQQATKKILNEISDSKTDSPVTKLVRSLWDNQNVLSFLAMPAVKDVFEVSSDITTIADSDIVLCGASASTGFLDINIFKENAVVVDVAVPPSIKTEVLNKLYKERPDVTYHLGGVAHLPQNQSIDFFVFPLDENECFACMAETFAVGFSGIKDFLNIGDLNKEIVLSVQKIAENAGFSLGSYKKKNSL